MVRPNLFWRLVRFVNRGVASLEARGSGQGCRLVPQHCRKPACRDANEGGQFARPDRAHLERLAAKLTLVVIRPEEGNSGRGTKI